MTVTTTTTTGLHNTDRPDRPHDGRVYYVFLPSNSCTQRRRHTHTMPRTHTNAQTRSHEVTSTPPPPSTNPVTSCCLCVCTRAHSNRSRVYLSWCTARCAAHGSEDLLKHIARACEQASNVDVFVCYAVYVYVLYMLRIYARTPYCWWDLSAAPRRRDREERDVADSGGVRAVGVASVYTILFV